MSKDTSNPVLYTLDGIEVRKTNKTTLSLSEGEWVRLITAFTNNHGHLSIPKIIAIMSQACPKCGNDEITLTVPKGQLSQSKSFSGGTIKSYNQKDE